jgi:hypothetical protein
MSVYQYVILCQQINYAVEWSRIDGLIDRFPNVEQVISRCNNIKVIQRNLLETEPGNT